MKLEYRVTWKREGQKRKYKRFATLKAAERFMLLFGDEPWKAYGKNPDEYACCSGYRNECGCEGETVRQLSDRMRTQMPKLETLSLQSREVGEWRAACHRRSEGRHPPPWVGVLAEAAQQIVSEVRLSFEGYPEQIESRSGHIKDALAQYRKWKEER